MRLPEEPESPFQINIVPMIDVIFAILTFFIMSSLFLSRSTGLPIALPHAKTSENQPPSQIVITLDKNGQLQLNQQSITLTSLQPKLRALVGTQTALIVIHADAQAQHGSVVAVMDQLRQLPNVRMAIAAQP